MITTQVVIMTNHNDPKERWDRALKEKEYPFVESLTKMGMIHFLAKSLARYQRGGVGFVVNGKRKAFLTYDMGLKKTVQAIVAISLYQSELPLVVIFPSSAHYHRQTEVLN